jgi:hypothetical protein
MGRHVYPDDDDSLQVLPDWTLEKWAKGHAIYADPDHDRHDWLYKYMRADRAEQLLTDRAIWFAAPHRWDDPHERWWCEQLFREGSHLATASPFGTCWTRRWRDECFWRIYSCKCVDESRQSKEPELPSRALPAVRFRARTGAIYDWLRAAAKKEKCKVFMGDVRYCPLHQMREVASQLRPRGS